MKHRQLLAESLFVVLVFQLSGELLMAQTNKPDWSLWLERAGPAPESKMPSSRPAWERK